MQLDDWAHRTNTPGIPEMENPMSEVADTQRFDALYKTLSTCVSKLDQLPPEAIDEALALAEQGQAAYTQAKARLEAATQRLDAMFAQRDPA